MKSAPVILNYFDTAVHQQIDTDVKLKYAFEDDDKAEAALWCEGCKRYRHVTNDQDYCWGKLPGGCDRYSHYQGNLSFGLSSIRKQNTKINDPDYRDSSQKDLDELGSTGIDQASYISSPILDS